MPNAADVLSPTFSTERFQYVFEKERATFYELKGNVRLQEFFKPFQELVNHKGLLSDEEKQGVLHALDSLKYRVERDEFGRRFRKLLIDNAYRPLVTAASLYKEFPELE